MARIATDPFEQGNYPHVNWNFSGFPAVVTSPARKWRGYGGDYSIRLSANANQTRVTQDAGENEEHSHVFVKVAFYMNNANAYGRIRLFDNSNPAGTVASTTGLACEFGIGPGSAGTLRAYRGNTEIANSGISPTAFTWHLLEAEIYLHDTNGIFRVWYDDVLIINFSGDTLNGTTKITRLAYFGAINCHMDDGGMNSITLEYGGGSGIQANGTLTMGGQPNDGDQVEIGGQTYTFNTVLGGSGSIFIGATTADTINNLVAAINNGAGEGTTWGNGTPAPNQDVTAAAGPGSIAVTAIAYGADGNTITTTDPTDTSGNLTWGGATLSGGSGVPVAGEVLTAAGGGSAIVTFAVDDGTGTAGTVTIENWNATDFVDSESLTGDVSFSGNVVAPNAAYKNGLAPNSTRLGNGFITRVSPTGNGTYSEMTGSDGNQVDNYLEVDERVTTSSPTTSVEAASAGDRDTYTGDFASAIPSGATIETVTLCYQAESSLGGIDGLSPMLRIGTVDYNSDSPGSGNFERFALAAGYDFYAQTIDRNPSIISSSDQSWSRSVLIGTFEFGQKFVS